MKSNQIKIPALSSKIFRFVLLSASLLLLSQTAIQQIASAAESKPFTPADFPDSVSKIYLYTMLNGKVVVEAIQVKRLNEKHSNPRYCRAWISMTTTGKKIQCNYFEEINGLGGAYGLYCPNQNMPTNYHCIVKLGDYDGRLMLFSDAGNYWNLPGGSFFLTKDKQYLFSTHECDAPAGIAVFDLKKGTPIFETEVADKEVPPIVDKWYFDGTNYFFTTKTVDGASSNSDEREIFVFDSKAPKLEKGKISTTKLATLTEVKYDFNANSEPDLKAAEPGATSSATASGANATKEASTAK